ncbi:uncharacterized protein ASCRUDRAFT_56198 [Ascoidea rubescens DSM 1968]|uniref:Inhibitor I9 domain-containing protein n=1 Tax=Ascoidea rubescens DSM 1968 TaxID=1344418 RepID=A0A1D2VJG5_9ASCO|nr:hypothetical protein ASCRUDRAFT_56198 [Ascoidea rubescens DSM 1968]ODV61761.1 hypothetical protein ASCRUDRAFT_56198 [Ascoidea rubescens DSM 1968]
MTTKSLIVTLKEDVSDADYKKFKDDLIKLGAEITQEYNLFKGFSVTLPEVHSETLTSSEHVATVEPDAEVKILPIETKTAATSKILDPRTVGK